MFMRFFCVLFYVDFLCFVVCCVILMGVMDISLVSTVTALSVCCVILMGVVDIVAHIRQHSPAGVFRVQVKCVSSTAKTSQHSPARVFPVQVLRGLLAGRSLHAQKDLLKRACAQQKLIRIKKGLYAFNPKLGVNSRR